MHIMAKFLILLLLTFCLALQNAKSFPHNVAISVESTEHEMTRDFEVELAKSTTTTLQTTTDVAIEESTELSQGTDSESTEDFSYLPVLYNTAINRLTLSILKVVQYHLNTLLTVAHDYFSASLKALNKLPNKTPSIEANTTRLTNLLERLDGIDLSKNDLDALVVKIYVIDDLGDLYNDYAKLLRLVGVDPAVLSELYTKLGLFEQLGLYHI